MTEKDFENIYITGDTHAEFEELVKQTRELGLTQKDLLIILGDVGANFTNEMRDAYSKAFLSMIPSTILCIQGNHERRPTSKDIRWKYEEKEWMGGTVWIEQEFPNILFAKDGCRYEAAGRSFFVIGGAYSMDKPLRLRLGYPWFPDEQPSEEIKERCRKAVAEHGFREDIVLSHTCPYNDRPGDVLKGIDESKIDFSTEHFLQEIKDQITYNKWYCGHWHIDRSTPDVEFVFHRIQKLQPSVSMPVRDL